jgi:transcriptional regulator with XRE-family HTH domain
MEKTYIGFETTVGKHLKEIRMQKELSQEELSLQAGLDRSYISMVERGKRNPTLLVIFKICEVLEILPHNLIKNIENDL